MGAKTDLGPKPCFADAYNVKSFSNASDELHCHRSVNYLIKKLVRCKHSGEERPTTGRYDTHTIIDGCEHTPPLPDSAAMDLTSSIQGSMFDGVGLVSWWG